MLRKYYSTHPLKATLLITDHYRRVNTTTTMRTPEEIWYIWDLVFRVSTREELRTLCQVSKLFNGLAIPLLYRSVTLRKSQTTGENWDVLPSDVDDPAKAKDLSYSLFYRLLHDEKIRAQTRELTLAKIKDKADFAPLCQKLQSPDDPLTGLVKQMPNLDNIYFLDKFPLTERLLSALNEHKRSTRLHLLGYYKMRQISAPIPFVRTLHIKVPTTNTFRFAEGPVEHASTLRDVFAAYPNLEDLRVEVTRYRMTCDMRGNPFSRKILEFVSPKNNLSGSSLSLNGYVIGQEASFWLEQFPWHNLRSLSLGPDDNPGFLENVGHCVQNLTSFTITKFCKSTVMTHTGLDSFLSSFHTLEKLTAKGYVPSVHAVAHHPDLKYLCLHAIEHPDRERPILSVTEIELLDQSCPNLNTLEIDVNPDGIWPDPFIDSLARGFLNLHQLSIHVELGLRRMELERKLKEELGQQRKREMRQHQGEQFTHDSENSLEKMDEADIADMKNRQKKWMASVLTEPKARGFGKRFFGRRHEPSSLEKITLRTGERLRDFPQWRPLYSSQFHGDRFERIFEIYSPKKGDEPFLKELESESVRRTRKLRESIERRCQRLKPASKR